MLSIEYLGSLTSETLDLIFAFVETLPKITPSSTPHDYHLIPIAFIGLTWCNLFTRLIVRLLIISIKGPTTTNQQNELTNTTLNTLTQLIFSILGTTTFLQAQEQSNGEVDARVKIYFVLQAARHFMEGGLLLLSDYNRVSFERVLGGTVGLF